MRVVSLLPSATEIVGALGMMECLVGVSHECDYPPQVNDKPRVTQCEIHEAGLPSSQVDAWVRNSLASRGTLYTMDEALLRQLGPDVILTQKLCDVCAVGYGSVTALASTLPGPPQVINLEPSSVEDIFRDIQRVASALRVPDRGSAVVTSLRERVERVRSVATAANQRPSCLLLEWIDPPYCGGHWNPELIEIAGGFDPLGLKGKDSTRVEWGRVLDARPETIVLACCGYSIDQTRRDIPILRSYPGWDSLPAVQRERVFVVDGCAYFSRPGPRIVDSLELLSRIIHPELFSEPKPDLAIRLRAA